MKKFGIQMTILVIIILGGLYLAMNQSIWQSYLPSGVVNPPTNKIKIGETLLNVEVADSQGERAKGLSGRDKLSSDSGMLFIFDTPKQYQFWMKGMKFPLDMIFIKDGKVVDLLNNVPISDKETQDVNLPRYQSTLPMDILLETNSGFIQTNNIKIGDSLFTVSK